jgi:hypothetical protein
MTVEGFDATIAIPPEQKMTKMVQIVVMFQTDSDTDALSVKTAISEALKDRKGMAIHFTMHEQPKQ